MSRVSLHIPTQKLSQFGFKIILSYTDDAPELKPVSVVNEELIWKRNSMSCQRFNWRTCELCQEMLLTELDQ